MYSRIAIFSTLFAICFASKNYLPDAPADENECSRRMNYLTDVNLNTKIIFPPLLIGKWVSERCEIRTGPQYILRSYTFYPNNTFYLLQFYYTDDSCSSITHVVTAKGVYKYKESVSSKLLYIVDEVTVTPHDTQFINNLPSSIDTDCQQMAGKYWKLFKESVVYEHYRKFRDTDDNVEPFKSTRTHANTAKQRDADIRCLSLMNVSFDELSTVRVQQNPAIDDKNTRYELLLSNSHPYQERKKKTSLLKFQLPLILLNETADCPICTIISTRTQMFAPHLTAKPTLPLFFSGEWISQRCEPRSMGLHTVRIYRFNHYTAEWQLETRYYSNYACSNLLMIHETIGRYQLGSDSIIVAGATEIDFVAEKSTLTIIDQSILDTIESDPDCGIALYWKLNVKKEIPSKEGCSTIALANPLVRYDIIKLDVDYDGSYILLLGDDGSIDTEHNEFERPTMYEYPLVQCDNEPKQFPELSPTPSSASIANHTLWVVLIVLCKQAVTGMIK